MRRYALTQSSIAIQQTFDDKTGIAGTFVNNSSGPLEKLTSAMTFPAIAPLPQLFSFHRKRMIKLSLEFVMVMIALLGFVLPFMTGNRPDGVWVSLFLSALWIVIFVTCAAKRMKLRLFVYPFGLLILVWPSFVTFLFIACRWGHDCI